MKHLWKKISNSFLENQGNNKTWYTIQSLPAEIDINNGYLTNLRISNKFNNYFVYVGFSLTL